MAAAASGNRVVDLPEPILSLHWLATLRVAAGELAPGVAFCLPDGREDAIHFAFLQGKDAPFPGLALPVDGQLGLLCGRLNKLQQNTGARRLCVVCGEGERRVILQLVAQAQNGWALGLERLGQQYEYKQ